jgi:hypothetical protein
MTSQQMQDAITQVSAVLSGLRHQRAIIEAKRRKADREGGLSVAENVSLANAQREFTRLLEHLT